MQINIRKNKSFNFKLHRFVFCTVGKLGNRTLLLQNLSKNQQNI